MSSARHCTRNLLRCVKSLAVHRCPIGPRSISFLHPLDCTAVLWNASHKSTAVPTEFALWIHTPLTCLTVVIEPSLLSTLSSFVLPWHRYWPKRPPDLWGAGGSWRSIPPQPLTWLRAKMLYALKPADANKFKHLRDPGALRRPSDRHPPYLRLSSLVALPYRLPHRGPIQKA